MIAVDTNVLLRYLLADDASQHSKARALIESQRPVLITDVVLVETLWTLTGKRYQLGRVEAGEVVRGLIGDAAFRFESSQVVWSALIDYQTTKPVRGKALDFADALIVRKAQLVADGTGQTLKCVYSFDRAAQALPGVEKP